MLSLLISIVLSPLLFIQGKWVRYKTPVLPEPEGSRAGVVGSGTPLKLWVIGDSAAAGVGAAHQDQALAGQLVARLAATRRVHWRLEAQTGDTTKDALARLDRMGPGKFDLVVVALGVNDVTRAVPLPVWLNRQRRLLERLHSEFGAQQIILSGLPPMGEFPLLPQPLRWVLGRQAARLDQALRAEVAALRTVSVTTMVFDLSTDHMAEDGFHPGPEVYAAWADLVMDQISAPAP